MMTSALLILLLLIKLTNSLLYRIVDGWRYIPIELLHMLNDQSLRHWMHTNNLYIHYDQLDYNWATKYELFCLPPSFYSNYVTIPQARQILTLLADLSPQDVYLLRIKVSLEAMVTKASHSHSPPSPQSPTSNSPSPENEGHSIFTFEF